MDYAYYIQLANDVATEAHRGQFRRDKRTPYITHPQAVADRVEDRLKPIASLHDTIEDTKLTLAEIRAIFPKYVADAVAALTRRINESYEDYIKRVCENVDAIIVKLADMDHNMSCQPSQHSIEKTAKFRPVLVDALKKHYEKTI